MILHAYCIQVALGLVVLQLGRVTVLRTIFIEVTCGSIFIVL